MGAGQRRAEDAARRAVPEPRTKGELEVGTNGEGEVVVIHPDIDADKDGVAHIVFSPAPARNFAATLVKKAAEAEAEVVPSSAQRRP